MSFTIGLLLIAALELMYPRPPGKHRPAWLWIAGAGLAATLIAFPATTEVSRMNETQAAQQPNLTA